MSFESSQSSAAGRTSTLTHPIIVDLLRSNMFDVQRGGTVIINVDDMVEEVADIIMEYLDE